MKFSEKSKLDIDLAFSKKNLVVLLNVMINEKDLFESAIQEIFKIENSVLVDEKNI